jgi:hypothetical protein
MGRDGVPGACSISISDPAPFYKKDTLFIRVKPRFLFRDGHRAKGKKGFVAAKARR